MQIVKVGGSLFHQPAVLKSWLEKLSAESIHETIILVPGGGPFADLIRDAQAPFALSESQAHMLAIDAMNQFGRLLAAICSEAQPVDLSTAALSSGLNIWLPDARELIQTPLAQDWTVTSDSIALWLAQQHQQPLTLLKTAPRLAGTLRQLSENQHIDAAFRTLYLACPVPLRLISAEMLTESSQVDWEIFDE